MGRFLFFPSNRSPSCAGRRGRWRVVTATVSLRGNWLRVPKACTWSRKLDADHRRLQVPRPLVDHPAPLNFFAGLTRQHQVLTVSDGRRQYDQAAGGVYAKCFGFLAEGFSLSCVSVDDYWQVDQQAPAGSAFGLPLLRGAHLFF